MGFALSEPYFPREISFRRHCMQAGWQLKCYTIHHHARPPVSEADLDAAIAHAASLLPAGESTPPAYGVGFLVLHAGREANFLLVDWWAGENMLYQALALSELDRPHQFLPAPPHMTACVWELAVIGFERQAWIETVLANPDGPDLQAYLERRLSAQI